MAKSSSRNSRFSLGSEHMKLKTLIEKREGELKKLLHDHQSRENFIKAHLASFKSGAAEVSSIEMSPAAHRIFEETRYMSQDGAVEEVQLDLSFVKAG